MKVNKFDSEYDSTLKGFSKENDLLSRNVQDLQDKLQARDSIIQKQEDLKKMKEENQLIKENMLKEEMSKNEEIVQKLRDQLRMKLIIKKDKSGQRDKSIQVTQARISLNKGAQTDMSVENDHRSSELTRLLLENIALKDQVAEFKEYSL